MFNIKNYLLEKTYQLQELSQGVISFDLANLLMQNVFGNADEVDEIVNFCVRYQDTIPNFGQAKFTEFLDELSLKLNIANYALEELATFIASRSEGYITADGLIALIEQDVNNDEKYLEYYLEIAQNQSRAYRLFNFWDNQI